MSCKVCALEYKRRGWKSGGWAWNVWPFLPHPICPPTSEPNVWFSTQLLTLLGVTVACIESREDGIWR
jgi:hypothetical protein